jgi:sialate O-acetylesterase
MSGCNSPKIELKIAQVFSNNMVLQQDQPNAVWGTAAPNTEITLTSSWGEEIIVQADSFGHWTLLLPTPRFNKNEPSKNYSIHVTDGDSKIDISDVLIGEVWLASGQSNMEWRMNECKGCVINQTEEIKNSTNPSIRMFSVPKDLTIESLKHTKWLSANQKNTGDFSATAYYFAKKLNDELKVPIGIINSSWGGTRIESWISSKKLNSLDETKSFIPEDYTFLGYQDYIRKQNDSLIRELNNKYGFSNFNVPQPKILMGTGFPVQEELFNQFLKKWENLNLGDKSFKDPEFNDDSWENWTPGLHTYGGLKSKGRFESVFDESDPLLSDGVIWFRTELEINDISKDFILQVEKGIDDVDQTYFNGKLIGNTLGWNLERKYIIPKRLLREGKNIIAFRISDTGGGGGFNSQVRIFNDQDSIILPFEKFKFKHLGFILNGMSLIVHNFSNNQLVELLKKSEKTFSQNHLQTCIINFQLCMNVCFYR